MSNEHVKYGNVNMGYPVNTIATTDVEIIKLAVRRSDRSGFKIMAS